MGKKLDAAVENLVSTYMSLSQAAASYIDTLDAKEVAAALAKAKPDTAEYVALTHLNELMQSKQASKVVEEKE